MGASISHGGLDYAELAAHDLRPEALLDFSSNLNPFGPPSGVRPALAALDPAPYPDRSCVWFRTALAARHGCAPEQILVGNGSNELIHLVPRALAQPGDLAVVVGPTFGEYRYASHLAGMKVVEWRATPEQDFAFDRAAITAQIRQNRPRLTWLCAPNNPTGVAGTMEDIAALADACAEVKSVLVIDRAYQAFAREPWAYQPQRLPSHVLQLCSLTKSYALAGLRVGYLLGEPELLRSVAAYQPTWSVSSAAQAAGLAALADPEFLPRTVPLVWAASDTLAAGIALLGLRVWRGALPFLLVWTGNGLRTRRALLQHGCVVRDCASFGLPEWVRVAPQGAAANARLLQAWREAA